MSELNIKVRKSQDNGSTFRATPDTLYMGGVGSAKVDTLHFEVPEEWAGCAITLHVQRLSGALPDPQMLDENNCVVVDRRWTQEKQGSWMLLAVDENGYIAMTKPGQYTCYETIDTNSTTETITPSVYEQFVAAVEKWGQTAVDAAAKAKSSEEKAAGSASASAGFAAAADRSKSAAAGSATEAAGSASAAEKSKAAAEMSENNAAKHEETAKKAAEEAGAKAGTDKTLTIKNAPADAAVVGGYILDLNKDPPELVFYSKAAVDELLAKKANKDVILDGDGNVIFYSKAAVDELLAGKLGLHDTADNSNKLNGYELRLSDHPGSANILVQTVDEDGRTCIDCRNDASIGLTAIVASGVGYVRFGDGTQICWGETGQITVKANSTVTTTITYPVAFVSGHSPELSLTIAGNSKNDNYSKLVLHTTSRLTTSCDIYFKNSSFDQMSPIAQWIAIGRWK